MDNLIIVTVITVFLGSGPAVAQSLRVECPARSGDPASDKTAAGRWFAKGIEFAEAANFTSAEQAFRCSFRLVEHPATLLNIAKAAKQGRSLETALGTYREFLERYSDDEKVPFVIEEIARIEAESAVVTDASAEKKQFTPEESGDILPVQDAEVFGKETDNNDSPEAVRPDQTQEKAVAAVPLSMDAKAIDVKKLRQLKTAGWSTLYIGGSALLAAIATGSIALSYNNDLENNCPAGECDTPNHAKVDSLEKIAVATNVLIGVGATATFIGAALLVVATRKQRTTGTSVSVLLQLAPGYTGLGIGGAF